MSTRSRISLSFATALAALALLGLTFGACKQGAGERCQRTEDCMEPLICNQGTQLCQAGASNAGDSGVDTPLDADELDAGTDAAIDAPVDAAIDAAPTL